MVMSQITMSSGFIRDTKCHSRYILDSIRVSSRIDQGAWTSPRGDGVAAVALHQLQEMHRSKFINTGVIEMTVSERIAALGNPRGLKILLADMADCTANEVTCFVAGRYVMESRRVRLEDALAIVEAVYSQPVRPELEVGNILRAAQVMFATA
jgi:hypothetical protein